MATNEFKQQIEILLRNVESNSLTPSEDLVLFLLKTNANTQAMGRILLFTYAIQKHLSAHKAELYPETFKNNLEEWVSVKPILISLLENLSPTSVSVIKPKDFHSSIRDRFSPTLLQNYTKIGELVAELGPNKTLEFLLKKKAFLNGNGWSKLEIALIEQAINWANSSFLKGEISFLAQGFLITSSVFWIIEFLTFNHSLKIEFLNYHLK